MNDNSLFDIHVKVIKKNEMINKKITGKWKIYVKNQKKISTTGFFIAFYKWE